MSTISSRLLHDPLPNDGAHDQAITPALPDAQLRKAENAAEKFEAYFIGHMLHQTRKNAREVGGDTAQSKNGGDDMLDWADELLADALAKQHAFGIADVMLRQLVPGGNQSQGSHELMRAAPQVAVQKQ